MSSPAYFDSSIWIAYAMGPIDRNFSFAEDLIKKMDGGEFKVYLSTLVMMEVLDVIRKKTAQFETWRGGLDSTKEANLIEKIKKKVKDFIDAVTIWESQNKIILADPDEDVEDFWKEALNQIKNYWGSLKEDWKCRSCRKSLTPPKYSYRGLGQWDFQHAMTAKGLNALVLYSTDKDFSHLNGNQNFQSLQFVTKP